MRLLSLLSGHARGVMGLPLRSVPWFHRSDASQGLTLHIQALGDIGKELILSSYRG
jgi:hypothetical protein